MSGSGLDTRTYWEERLSGSLDLRGTGHRAFGLDYNLWLYQAQLDVLTDLLNAHGVDLTGRSVLDAGSGTGFFVKAFADRGAEPVMGMDITEASAVYLQEIFPESTFLTADISAHHLPVRCDFHLVSAISVLYHILEEQRFDRALSNLCMHVQAGGYLLVSDTFARPTLPTARHARFRTIDCYEAILARHQLHVLAVEPVYYYMNRTFVPLLGPKVIDALQLGQTLYQMDRRRRQRAAANGSGMKYLLAMKRS